MSLAILFLLRLRGGEGANCVHDDFGGHNCPSAIVGVPRTTLGEFNIWSMIARSFQSISCYLRRPLYPFPHALLVGFGAGAGMAVSHEAFMGTQRTTSAPALRHHPAAR